MQVDCKSSFPDMLEHTSVAFFGKPGPGEFLEYLVEKPIEVRPTIRPDLSAGWTL